MNAQLQTPEEEPGDESATEATALSKDTTFSVLKNRRRREVLKRLRAEDGEAKLSDLAEYIAAKENDIEIRELSSDQRKRVYIGLYQCHLPKMDDSGVIRFDKNRGDVELLEPATELFDYLESDEATAESETTDRREWANLGVAWGVGLFVLAGLANVPPLAGVEAQWWAILSTLALVALTSVEAVRRNVV
jgi:hypothetical protein